MSVKNDDWQRAMLATIFTIHAEAPAREDILAFMTGQDEIEGMARQVRTLAKEFPGRPRVEVVTLYAARTPEQQAQVFRPTQQNGRKVVIATNIAETSITIPGVTHVVDGCRVKAKVHQSGPGLDLLSVVLVSKAQARQRTGRAGREREGACYRLLTAAQFEALEEATVPEIQRSNLSSVVLTMLGIGVTDIQAFDFMDPPGREDLKSALRQLKLLGAVSPEEQQLTARGRRMAAFPLQPRLTAAILAAAALGCGEEVVTIVALLSAESPFLLPAARDRREEAEAAHRKFQAPEGDLVTLLNVWRAFRAGAGSAVWCRDQYLSLRHLQFAMEVRKQLVSLCRGADIALESSRDLDTVRRALAQGLFINVAQLTLEGHYVALDSGQHCHLHPQSVLFRRKPEVVVYTEMVHTSKTYLKDCTLVDVSWLHEFQAEYFRTHRIK
jgi:ATP-dependent RNA helicase DHX33